MSVEDVFVPVDPWFLRDKVNRKRGMIGSLLGASFRSAAMLRIALLVVKDWWRQPLEPLPLTNGRHLSSSIRVGVFRPTSRILSVVFAGFVGADLAGVRNVVELRNQLGLWFNVVAVILLISVGWQWYRFVKKIVFIVESWFLMSVQMSNDARRSKDMDLFGYSFGSEFRRRFTRQRRGKVVAFVFFSYLSALFWLTFSIGRL